MPLGSGYGRISAWGCRSPRSSGFLRRVERGCSRGRRQVQVNGGQPGDLGISAGYTRFPAVPSTGFEPAHTAPEADAPSWCPSLSHGWIMSVIEPVPRQSHKLATITLIDPVD